MMSMSNPNTFSLEFIINWNCQFTLGSFYNNRSNGSLVSQRKQRTLLFGFIIPDPTSNEKDV